MGLCGCDGGNDTYVFFLGVNELRILIDYPILMVTSDNIPERWVLRKICVGGLVI